MRAVVAYTLLIRSRMVPGMQSVRRATWVLLLVIPSLAYGQGQGWWGTAPHGFDEQTVIEVSGTVSDVQLEPRRAPASLRLHVGSEVFTVVLCPPWYLTQVHADLRNGDAVHVEGSKMMDARGNLHLMAARLRNERTGSVLELRAPDGQPRWLTDTAPFRK